MKPTRQRPNGLATVGTERLVVITFSANLGFLWTELSLPNAIHAAHRAGFAAVECHWPYDVPACDVSAALRETGLPMLGLNTRRGDVGAGDMGLSAVPGREAEARAAIDEAVTYATAIGAKAVHVMAGNAQGRRARATFAENLHYACVAGGDDMTMLIEPLNAHDAPDYFLRDTEQAQQIIEDVGLPNVRLMFDCYHVGRTEGDVLRRMVELRDIIGHIQFASVPDRAEPDHGDVDYQMVFACAKELGFDRPLGAEYRPTGATSDTLQWMIDLTGGAA